MRAGVPSLIVVALLAAACASRRETVRCADPEIPDVVWIRWSGAPLVAALPDAARPLDCVLDASRAESGVVAIRFRSGGHVSCAGMPDAPRIRFAYVPTGQAVDVDGESWESYRRER